MLELLTSLSLSAKETNNDKLENLNKYKKVITINCKFALWQMTLMLIENQRKRW